MARRRFRPPGLRAEYRRLATRPGQSGATGVVNESDLGHLPEPVAAYVRRWGAVGRPHVRGFRASIHGRIRSGADAPWMPFRGEQVNRYGEAASRVFFIRARRSGLPVDVLHVYEGAHATMRAAALSLVTVVDAAGPELDRAETVTLFNDMCVMAPGALVTAPVTWEPIDDGRARGTYTNAGHTVTAELVIDDEHRLVDFVSDDRLRASADGRSFTPQRWSTPIRGYRDIGGHQVGSLGEGRWHAPAPEGEFAYLEFVIDDLEYDGG